MAERDGILAVGAVTVIRRRDSEVEENYTEALRAGAVRAFQEASLQAQGLLASSPPYSDTRPIEEMITWLADKIRQT
jgi:hypothetical protein